MSDVTKPEPYGVVNQWGVEERYEFTPQAFLDEKGRCCGRKPLVYKRPSFHYFCCKCSRDFGADGSQYGNWAYVKDGDWFRHKIIVFP